MIHFQLKIGHREDREPPKMGDTILQTPGSWSRLKSNHKLPAAL